MKKGATKNNHRMRCGVTKCRHRFTLKRPLQTYKIKIRCPKCKDYALVRDVEAERQREMEKRKSSGKLCRCSGYPYPHDAGTMKGCVVAIERGEVMTDEDYQDYMANLNTPRGN